MQSDQTWIATYQALCERCPELRTDVAYAIDHWMMHNGTSVNEQGLTESSWVRCHDSVSAALIRDTLVRWLINHGWTLFNTNDEHSHGYIYRKKSGLRRLYVHHNNPDLLPCLLAAVESELKQ